MNTSTPVKKRVYSAPEQLEESPIVIKETRYTKHENNKCLKETEHMSHLAKCMRHVVVLFCCFFFQLHVVR